MYILKYEILYNVMTIFDRKFLMF